MGVNHRAEIVATSAEIPTQGGLVGRVGHRRGRQALDRFRAGIDLRQKLQFPLPVDDGILLKFDGGAGLEGFPVAGPADAPGPVGSQSLVLVVRAGEGLAVAIKINKVRRAEGHGLPFGVGLAARGRAQQVFAIGAVDGHMHQGVGLDGNVADALGHSFGARTGPQSKVPALCGGEGHGDVFEDLDPIPGHGHHSAAVFLGDTQIDLHWDKIGPGHEGGGAAVGISG